jgi:hypothetical protein
MLIKCQIMRSLIMKTIMPCYIVRKKILKKSVFWTQNQNANVKGYLNETTLLNVTEKCVRGACLKTM